VNLWVSFVSNSQPTILVQPSNCPFNDPTIHAETAPVRRVALRNHRSNATLSQGLAMRFGIIAAIPLHTFRTTAWSTGLSTNWRNRIHQRNQLGDIVRVRTGEPGGQGNALRIRNEVMFAARFRSICGVWTCFFPPRKARIEALSTTARDQSI